MITKEKLTSEFLIDSLEVSIQNSQSEQNISAILSGFSISAVIALIMIEARELNSMLLICSIASSWFFILTMLSRTFSLESLRADLRYLPYQDSLREQYTVARKAHNSLSLGSLLFFIGLLFFLILLCLSSFVVSTAFGLISSILGSSLLIYVFVKSADSSGESDYFDWDLEYDDL